MKLFLKTISIFLFVITFIISNKVSAQSINPNGDFELSEVGDKAGTDIEGWTLSADGASSAIFSITGDEFYDGSRCLLVFVASLGTNAWDIQVTNEPFTVVPGTVYTYSIWAKADVTGPIVNFTVGNPSYNEMSRQHQKVITTDWQEFTVEFTAPAGASAARAPIHLGESANSSYLPFTIYLDNLQIKSNTVGVAEENIPTEYNLAQNFPNPFNPETVIRFTIPASGSVRIVLYDLLGNVVKEIADGTFVAGQHQVKLDASGLASGVYFYKMETGSFVSTKKLMLLK